MDFDQIEMRQTIDQAARSNFANPSKIIGVNLVDVAADKLSPRQPGTAVEHLRRIIQVMNRTENEIEPVPILLDPVSTGGGSFGIVVQLDPGPNFYIRISLREADRFRRNRFRRDNGRDR